MSGLLKHRDGYLRQKQIGSLNWPLPNWDPNPIQISSTDTVMNICSLPWGCTVVSSVLESWMGWGLKLHPMSECAEQGRGMDHLLKKPACLLVPGVECRDNITSFQKQP